MKTRIIGTFCAAAALAAFDAKAETLRMQTFIPPVANPGKTFLTPWAEKIAKESGGKLKIPSGPCSSAARRRSFSIRCATA